MSMWSSGSSISQGPAEKVPPIPRPLPLPFPPPFPLHPAVSPLTSALKPTHPVNSGVYGAFSTAATLATSAPTVGQTSSATASVSAAELSSTSVTSSATIAGGGREDTPRTALLAKLSTLGMATPDSDSTPAKRTSKELSRKVKTGDVKSKTETDPKLKSSPKNASKSNIENVPESKHPRKESRNGLKPGTVIKKDSRLKKSEDGRKNSKPEISVKKGSKENNNIGIKKLSKEIELKVKPENKLESKVITEDNRKASISVNKIASKPEVGKEIRKISIPTNRISSIHKGDKEIRKGSTKVTRIPSLPQVGNDIRKNSTPKKKISIPEVGQENDNDSIISNSESTIEADTTVSVDNLEITHNTSW